VFQAVFADIYKRIICLYTYEINDTLFEPNFGWAARKEEK